MCRHGAGLGWGRTLNHPARVPAGTLYHVVFYFSSLDRKLLDRICLNHCPISDSLANGLSSPPPRNATPLSLALTLAPHWPGGQYLSRPIWRGKGLHGAGAFQQPKPGPFMGPHEQRKGWPNTSRVTSSQVLAVQRKWGAFQVLGHPALRCVGVIADGSTALTSVPPNRSQNQRRLRASRNWQGPWEAWLVSHTLIAPSTFHILALHPNRKAPDLTK